MVMKYMYHQVRQVVVCNLVCLWEAEWEDLLLVVAVAWVEEEGNHECTFD